MIVGVAVGGVVSVGGGSEVDPLFQLRNHMDKTLKKKCKRNRETEETEEESEVMLIASTLDS